MKWAFHTASLAFGISASIGYYMVSPHGAKNDTMIMLRTVGYPDGHNYTANLRGIYVDETDMIANSGFSWIQEVISTWFLSTMGGLSIVFAILYRRLSEWDAFDHAVARIIFACSACLLPGVFTWYTTTLRDYLYYTYTWFYFSDKAEYTVLDPIGCVYTFWIYALPAISLIASIICCWNIWHSWLHRSRSSP